MNNPMKIILGRDYHTNKKKFKGPMPKTSNYLVYKFLCNSSES